MALASFMDIFVRGGASSLEASYDSGNRIKKRVELLFSGAVGVHFQNVLSPNPSNDLLGIAIGSVNIRQQPRALRFGVRLL